jgi:K+-sensing histidine kinase KdpD
VRLGNKAVGVLAIRNDVGKVGLEAIANLVAIIVERAASQEMTSQARAARKSEQLKSSILDALAHEFKTPLTSIKAAATALLSKVAGGSTKEREPLDMQLDLSLPSVLRDRELMELAIRQVVDNALKYSRREHRSHCTQAQRLTSSNSA